MNVINHLVALRPIPVLGHLAYYLLKLLGVEIPRSVVVGKRVTFAHWSNGLVVHSKTVIEDDVTLFQQVTLGRSDAYKPINDSAFEGLRVKKGAVISAGAKILCKSGTLVVGENAVIGANAVLLTSTGDNEIWAGAPARKVGDRH